MCSLLRGATSTCRRGFSLRFQPSRPNSMSSLSFNNLFPSAGASGAPSPLILKDYPRAIQPLVFGKHLEFGSEEIYAGSEVPWHAHTSAEEVIYVVKGEGEGTIIDTTVTLNPGSVMYIPVGVKHRIVNTSKTDSLHITYTFSPSGIFDSGTQISMSDGERDKTRKRKVQYVISPPRSPVAGETFGFQPEPNTADVESPLKKERKVEKDASPEQEAISVPNVEEIARPPSVSLLSPGPGPFSPSSSSASSSSSSSSTSSSTDSQIVPGPPGAFEPGLFPCRKVDIYAKLNRIEEGTYGVVYRAQNQQTKEIVALKKIKIHNEKDGFPITSLREVKILMSHKHQNIVDVKEILVGGKDQSSFYIAMEYLDHDLKSLMQTMKSDTRFVISEVKCLMKQLLSAMAFLHDNWILHRDLKTSNLLYSNKGILKVADFGMAREYGSPLKPYTSLVITLWYRAPELLLGQKMYTAAVDMWSVGCIMAELITKEPLFPGKNEPEQIDKIFRILGTPTDKIWPGVTQLPMAKKINFASRPFNVLKQQFPVGSMTEKCFDLLNKLLTYDPSKRITAADALKHPWFEETPLAKETWFMPTWPSSHDKKKKGEEDAEEDMKMRILRDQQNEKDRYSQARSGAYGFRLKM